MSTTLGREFLPFIHRIGGVWIEMDRPRYGDQIYSHCSLPEHEWRHYHISTLKNLIRRGGVPSRKIGVALLPDQVEHVRQRHGIEPDHLQRLTREQLREPGIMVMLPDESMILVDGNHRYVRRFELGMPKMWFWVVTEESAKQALVALPPDLKLIAEKAAA